MSIDTSNKNVEDFKDRVTVLLGLKLPVAPDYIHYVQQRSEAEHRRRLPVRTKPQLWEAVQWASSLRDSSRASWEKASDRPSNAFLEGLEKVYPTLPRGAIGAETYAEFESAITPLKAAIERWEAATIYYANHRNVLEGLAKRYYQDVDQTPELPLIGKQEWLLDKPMLLTPGIDVRSYNSRALGPSTDYLEGLKAGFVHIKAGLQDPDSQPHNGLSYRVTDIVGDGKTLAFDFGPAWYFDYVNELESLGAELADHAGREGGDSYPLDELPLRGPPEEIFQLGNRCAVAGVNCLLIAKNYFKGEFTNDERRFSTKFFTHLRRRKVMEGQNTVHVVPAGTHQPLGESTPADRSIWMTAFRELCEEVFGVREAIRRDALEVDFMDLPEVRRIEAALLSGAADDPEPAARFYLLGVGLDPVTTKPEILVAIVIDWRKAARRWRHGDIPFGHKFNEEGKASPRPLSREELRIWALAPPQKLDDTDQMVSTLPAGAACMLLAAREPAYGILTGLGE